MSILKTKNKESLQEIIRAGMDSDFWQIIVEALQDSKEFLKQEQDSDDMKDLPPEIYKVENELLKAKRKYLDKLTYQNIKQKRHLGKQLAK